MKIVNLTGNEVLDGLCAPKMDGQYWGDHYRKYVEYDEDNILGLYYKQLDLKEKTLEALDREISINKKCWNQEYTWEHYTMCLLFSLVNRLEDVYNNTGITSDIKSPVITGIALYKNYPIGTLFPRELLNYKTYLEIFNNVSEISNDDRLKILKRVKYLLEQLMKYDVYPTHIYGGNIMVNPNDYSDVRLDGLDGPMVCRVESENYVKTLENRGMSLVRDTWSNFNRIFK